MNLFTQLAQQTFGKSESAITPRLAARFESASVNTEFTSNGIDMHTPAINMSRSTLNMHADAKDMSGNTLNMSSRATNMSSRATNMPSPTLNIQGDALNMHADGEPLQVGTQGIQATTATTQSTVLPNITKTFLSTRAELLRQPTIEPMLAPQIARTENQEPRTVDSPTVLGSRFAVFQDKLEPAPAIRVSIGRVDVRAVVRPPQPPRREQETPRAPAQTLDEYLRKGRGGQ